VSGFAFVAVSLVVDLGETEVLHGFDLRLRAGRWTCIVGPNGAGKTTLVKALARLLPHRGHLRMLGRASDDWSLRERARTLAWLGQNEGGADDLLARDVVMLGRLPHQPWLGGASSADGAAVESAMRKTGSWEWRDRPLGRLSGGERQRVLLARALAVQAPLLVLDEPLANLDPPHQSDWLRIVRAHVAAGGTVVSVLHELSMALQADDLVVMAGGYIAHQGPCADPATHLALVRVFNERISVHSVAGQWVALPEFEAGAA
jgi:iron complex transport system ATP-binding protein